MYRCGRRSLQAQWRQLITGERATRVKAILPRHSNFAHDLAVDSILASGTQNQITSARNLLGTPAMACALTSLANRRALLSDPEFDRAITASIVYPARRNDTARAAPRFPAPTMAIVSFAAMPGSIAEAAH